MQMVIRGEGEFQTQTQSQIIHLRTDFLKEIQIRKDRARHLNSFETYGLQFHRVQLIVYLGDSK
jgi:hypothetical protein